MTLSPIKKAFMLFMASGLLQFSVVNLAKAQQPAISYSQSNFNFTKGIAITPIPSPNNSGGAIPNKIRGGVEESIGIGEFQANKISKSGTNNLVSIMFNESKLQKVDLTSKNITATIGKRDRPWSVVKDSKGNIYWTEPGKAQIIKNPSKPADATSFFGAFLEIVAEADIDGISDAVGVFNGINEIYSHFSGGDDLLRKITGQQQGQDREYDLKFSGTIYKLAPDATQPEVFVTGIQSPTGIAIDKNDNLYITCFTSNYEVKGGYTFSFGEIEKKDGETGGYNAYILKISPNKVQTEIGSWEGIDYPNQIGIDNDENIIVMYNSGPNMEETSLARINKYQPGQTSGETYLYAEFLLKGGTKLSQNLPIFLDMAVDGSGNLYLGDFYKDRILMLPKDGTSANDLQVFSENVSSPNALYVDLSTNQLWVKDGKYTTTGAIKKLSLYGYSVSPSLPVGLTINANGTITGTAGSVSPNTTYTLTASNDKGFSKANFNLEVKQIAAPNLSYATTTYNLPIGQSVTIPTPHNAGGSFNQQIGPLTTSQVYKGATRMGGFAFDAIGNKYFVQTDSNRIMKIDPSGKSSVYLANVNQPSDIAIDKKTGAFYYSLINGDAGSLFSILPGFDKPTELTKGSVWSIAIDHNGDLYTVLAGNGQIYKFLRKEARYEAVISNLKNGTTYPISIAISGNNLYILYSTGGLEKRLLDNLSSKTVIPTGNISNGFELDVDDYGNLFIAANNYIYKMPAGTTTLEPLHLNGWYFSGLGVDRDNNLYAAPIESNTSDVTVVKVTSGGYSISPSLPAGLTFNSNGSITGTPTSLSTVRDYTISASNPLGTSSTTIKIGVNNIPTSNLQYTVPSILFKGTTIANITATVTGGVPQSFSISPALPSGLSFNTNNGTISGTPNVSSLNTVYTVTANNTAGSKTATFNLAVTEVPPASLAYNLASQDLQKDILVEIKPTITGGSNGVTYSVNPALPNGLIFNTSTGVISGKPTTITSLASYTITITNDGGSKQTAINLAVKLDPPSKLIYVIAPGLQKDIAISSVTPTYNGAGVSNFSIQPALPAGLSFNEITGVISGKPTEERLLTTYTVTASNAGGSTTGTFQFSVKVDAPNNLKYDFAHTNLLNHNAIPAVTPTYTGSPATSFEVEPSLPAGLTLNPTTGVISGTPTAITTSKFYTVTAKNLGGQGTASFSLLVTELAPTDLQYTFSNSSLLRDVAIAAVRPSYNGGTATSFSINPTLPAGLSLNPNTGIISGTPTAISSNTNYTVTASNSAGNTTKSFSLLVKIDPPVNLRYNFQDTELQKDVLIAEATPRYSGSPIMTFSIDKTLPTGLTFNTSNGKISGTPTAVTSPTDYTVTGTNDAGVVTTSFKLSVARIPIPDISYANAVHKFTKGTSVTIPAPENTGIAIPQQRVGEEFFSDVSNTQGVATDLNGTTYMAYLEDGVPKIKKIAKGETELSEFVTSGLGTATPTDLAVDVAGNIYMSAGSVIKKIDKNKTITDFATGLNNVSGLFIDTDNDLYVAVYGAGEVWRYKDCNPSAKAVLVTGQTHSDAFSPPDNPKDVVVDKQKNIYTFISGQPSKGNGAWFGFVYKFFASENYSNETRRREISRSDEFTRATIDNRGNIYVSADNSIIILDGYTFSQKGRIYPQNAGGGKIIGVALDANQNVHYAISKVTNGGLGKSYQFGYNTNSLPDGLVLNADGTITGTPSTVQVQTNYGVTANSFYGSSTANLKITIVDNIPQFNYTEANQILTAGVSALDIDPVKVGGPVSSYSISPTTLPAGINFNTTTGKLSGTPSVVNDNVITYTISATNTGGTGSTTVTFKIIDKAPSALVYASNHILYLNKQFSGEVPTVAGGTVTNWSVNPALPEGLFIDSKTGAITGYPRETSAAQNYTVTAENSGGFTTAIVKVEVKDLPPNISYALRSSFKFKKDEIITPINAPSNDGGPIVSYSALSGLPVGLNLNTSTGQITGKPTQLKSATDYKIMADGGQWGRDTATVRMEVISNPPNIISYDGPITIVKGTAINTIRPIYAAGDGDAVERFSITPELPQGLTFNTSNGEISGTPAEIFGSNGQLFYVKAENGAGSNTAMLILILKDLAPAITYSANNVFTKGTNVELNVNSTGGAVEKYHVSPALPDGLSLNSITGKISGVPTNLTIKTSYTVTGTNYGNPESTSSFNITVVDKTPQISYTVPQVLDRTVEIEDITVNSTGGAVVGYTVSPALPAGLSLNATTGVISGTPTTSTAAKNYVVTATNTGGSHTATINFAVKNAKPVVAYGSSYEFNRSISIDDIEPTSTGGNQITFSVTPALPNGLTLNAQTGVISGTATVTSSLKTYTLKAVNDGGEDSATFTIVVNEKPPGQISYTALTADFYVGYSISPISPAVENGGGQIASYSISPTNLAPGLTFNTSTGVISGTPTSDFIRTTYTITGHNSGGTSQTTITFAVIKLSATVNKTDAKCFGSATGTATAVVVGGKAPYSYTWSSNAGNSETAIGLKVGTYTVTIKDANNSSITVSVTINEPLQLEITNISKTDNQQNGGASGSATATVAGGTAPYTYAWSSNSSVTQVATGLAEGTYTLTVTDANNCSTSKTVFIDAPPAAPSNLQVQAGNAKNTLSWQPSAEADLASYKVYGGTTSNPTILLKTITAPITNYTHENLINGSTYYYRITAIDKAGYESEYGSQANATPKGVQVINFSPLQAKTYGDADFDAGATASSNLAVTLTTDNPQVATIVNGKIHIVGAGTVNIAASQLGNEAWLAASVQTQLLIVNKRQLNISAIAQNKVYDAERDAVIKLSDNRIQGDEITTDYAYALFNNKNVGTAKSVAVSGLSIGGAAAQNYNHNTSVNTIANITAKPLTITADNKTTIQGLPLPSFTVSYSGFVNGEDSNILTAKPVLSTTAINTSPEGTYLITGAGATAQNYSITFVNGTLTVQPGTPTSLALTQVLLLENQPSGTIAGTLSSIAPDPNATFTYTLVTGNGAADNSKFAIQGNTIRTLSAFDYESQQNFNIRIRTTTQYGTSLEQTFTINLTDVNEIPTLSDISNQTICFTSAQQNVALSGITAGPETHQTTALTVSSGNNNLFSALSVGNVNNGNATLNYRVANGQSGTATITVTVTDNGGTANNGVNTVSKSFTITVNPLPQVTITSELGTTFAKGKTTKLAATGGVSYQWSGSAGIVGGRNTATIEVRPESVSNTYTVVVTSAEGCTTTQSITLHTEEDITQISGTNIVTPNGDGVNDNLIIKNLDLYPNNELEIFDRAGRKIYSKKGYQNDWNGSFNGIPLAEGTYYYIINFIGVGKYKGFITIIKD